MSEYRVNDPDAIAEVLAEYPRMRHAITTRDYAALVDLHDREFLGTELPGHLITADEHIATTMNSRNLQMEFSICGSRRSATSHCVGESSR